MWPIWGARPDVPDGLAEQTFARGHQKGNLMRKRFSSLPVLVVVAVVALVLGSIGTAVAGPAMTKAKVKKIATKVVKKQAPSLSVASAATAGNAANLNGLPAGAYQDRAAYTSVTGLTAVAVAANTATELRPAVSLTLGAGDHFVAVTGGAAYYAANTQTATWYSVDAVCALSASFGFDHRVQGSGLATGENAAFNVLQPLAAGSTHTFRLCGDSTGGAATSTAPSSSCRRSPSTAPVARRVRPSRARAPGGKRHAVRS